MSTFRSGFDCFEDIRHGCLGKIEIHRPVALVYLVRDLACHLKLKLGHPSYCNRLRLGSERYISRRVS